MFPDPLPDLLTDIEMAVMDAARAEELVEFLGLDEPAFVARYRALLPGLE